MYPDIVPLVEGRSICPTILIRADAGISLKPVIIQLVPNERQPILPILKLRDDCAVLEYWSEVADRQ